jgi:membrane protein implicated in regulation of membrane protease activity
MSPKLKILAIIQGLFAFFIVFALNYFALGMPPFLSFTGAAGFTLLLGGWAAYRYKRYLKKKEVTKKDAEKTSESGEDT